MWHASERGKVPTRVWWENVREGDYLEYLGVHWRIILKWIFRP